MRIALDGLLLHGPFSGVEVAILSLAQALGAHGAADYTLFVPGRCPAPDLDGPRLRTVRVRGPTHVRAVRLAWEQAVFPGRLRAGGFDLVHAPGYLAPLAARLPVVLTVYDLIALRFPAWCRPANRVNYALLLPPSVRKAAGIVVPSEATRRDLAARFPGAEARTAVIPLGIDAAFAPRCDPAAQARLRARYGLPPRFILFVGDLEPKKNLPRLIDAFRLLRAGGGPDHGLVLAGHPSWGDAELRRRIAAAGLGGEVVLTGFVPAADLPDLYGMADVLAFPSRYEGFGIPPLEAMACGVPVVASSAGALPEVVGDAGLLVDPDDEAALAGALRDALTRPDLRAELAARGRERAARFTWRRAAEATERFYGAVLQGGYGKRAGALP